MTDSFFKSEPDEKPSGDIPTLDDSAESQESGTGEEGEGFRTEEGRMAAIMAYIPILCFIPLLNMKDNKEAHFHARQGVLLFLIEVLAVIFLIDGISRFVFKALLIIAVALSVVGIYFALQGKNYKLPIIGDLADKAKL
ncbi:MAG: hypothetical protein JSU74_06750 [Candidatus Zixiibacteriota bacterium]|nr:MAG: hypothetical protein JSU74_06750 [candidate division Zixibacteria bacterium]